MLCYREHFGHETFPAFWRAAQRVCLGYYCSHWTNLTFSRASPYSYMISHPCHQLLDFPHWLPGCIFSRTLYHWTQVFSPLCRLVFRLSLKSVFHKTHDEILYSDFFHTCNPSEVLRPLLCPTWRQQFLILVSRLSLTNSSQNPVDPWFRVIWTFQTKETNN